MFLSVHFRSTSSPFPVHFRSIFAQFPVFFSGLEINKIRTPINDIRKPEPEIISSRSAVLQAPRLSVLQTLNKQNNSNNSNTNNNIGISLRVPQITLNGSKTVRLKIGHLYVFSPQPNFEPIIGSFLTTFFRKAAQEYQAMIRQYVKTFPKTVKPVRTGPRIRNPTPMQKRIKDGL